MLARFALERALQQILATAASSSSPTELLQRLFDTLGDTVFEASASHATHDRERSIAPTTVERLALREGSVPTYNLEVGTHHNYFAAWLLVHDRLTGV